MIERYFEDTKPLQQEIEDYMQTDQTAVNLRTEMILYVKALQAETVGLDEKIAAVQENCSFNRTGVPSIRSGVRTQSHKYAVE